jgi:Outer membrane protein beta-barrel domain
MKRLILAFLAAGTIVTANAQEPQSILLYGNLGITTTTNPDNSKTTNWMAAPGVGFQFNHNWTLGLQISWGQDASKSVAGDKYTVNSYAVGPFARYTRYIGKSETFYWYSQLNVDYAGGYNTSEGNPAVDKHTGVSVSLMPAVGANLGRGLGLNFSIGGLGYSSDKYTGTLDGNVAGTANTVNATKSFWFNFGQTVNVGISKNFNCGHKMHSNHEPGDEVHRRKADKMEDEDDAAPKAKKKERSRDDDE